VKTRTNLYVLRRTAMPAVLVELGFISNYDDAMLMLERPALFAEGIYNGLLDYFGFL
jgi:N-acetylmuramoyl-L-alanine amidase